MIPQSLQESIAETVDQRHASLGETIEIRKVLEIWAVARAAEAPTKDKLSELQGLMRIMKRNSGLRTERQIKAYSEADSAFHEVIAQMSGNSIYVHLIHFLSRLISQSVGQSQKSMPMEFAATNERAHKRIYQALEAGDPEAAQEAMREHFAFVEQRFKPGEKSGRS